MAIRTAKFRRLGVALLLAESAAFGAASLWFCYELITAKPTHLVAAFFELGIFLLFGAALLFAAKRLPTGARSGRTPALLINLIALPISYYLAQAGRWLIGAPIAVVAVMVIVALIAAEK
jgi:hypothetical protein